MATHIFLGPCEINGCWGLLSLPWDCHIVL